ncbi:hypothetical protein ACPA1H_21985 [Ectopseudomonas chengduensis]
MNNDIQTAPGSLAFLFFLVGGLGLLSFLLLGFITKETTQQAVVETQGAHYARGRLQQENTDNFVEEIESGTQPSVEGDTEAERIGLAILRKMNSAHSYFKPDDIEGLSALVMSHAADLGRDEAREFVSLLGRQKNEDIESWFGRALKLAPYQLSTEDATPWLTAVYRLAILLEVDIWFGLNEVEEKEIVRKILAEIDDKYQSLG